MRPRKDKFHVLIPFENGRGSFPRLTDGSPQTDFAVVDADIESGKLLDTVARFDEPLVKELRLFDVFTGDPIPEGRKSVSFRVVYQSDDRTLEDEAVNTIHRNLTQRLITEFGAALPA